MATRGVGVCCVAAWTALSSPSATAARLSSTTAIGYSFALSPSASNHISRRFASNDVWVPKPHRVGTILPPPVQYAQLFPEGLTKSMKHLTELTPIPSFIYRQTTDDVITKLSAMKEGGFPEAGTSSSTLYVHGSTGVGKSSLLAHVVVWARMNGWLVLYINDGKELIESGERIIPSKSWEGYWDQVCVSGEKGPAMSLLHSFLSCHSDLLKTLSLKSRHSHLPSSFSGQTLFDLVKFGVDKRNEEVACDVLHSYRRELNLVTKCPVLIAVDGYSAFEGTSSWVDPSIVDWSNSHKKYPRMPSEKLSLIKMLMLNEDDSHGLVNGAYLISTESGSGKKQLREFSKTTGKRLASSGHEVPPYTLEESSAMIQYYAANSMILGDAENVNPSTCAYIHQISGGIPREIFKYCRLLL